MKPKTKTCGPWWFNFDPYPMFLLNGSFVLAPSVAGGFGLPIRRIQGLSLRRLAREKCGGEIRQTGSRFRVRDVTSSLVIPFP